jgi:hypothetical protein
MPACMTDRASPKGWIIRRPSALANLHPWESTTLLFRTLLTRCRRFAGSAELALTPVVETVAELPSGTDLRDGKCS